MIYIFNFEIYNCTDDEIYCNFCTTVNDEIEIVNLIKSRRTIRNLTNCQLLITFILQLSTVTYYLFCGFKLIQVNDGVLSKSIEKLQTIFS